MSSWIDCAFASQNTTLCYFLCGVYCFTYAFLRWCSDIFRPSRTKSPKLGVTFLHYDHLFLCYHCNFYLLSLWHMLRQMHKNNTICMVLWKNTIIMLSFLFFHLEHSNTNFFLSTCYVSLTSGDCIFPNSCV